MEIHEILEKYPAAMVEYYDESARCDEANTVTEQTKALMGPDAPVFRIDVSQEPREKSLVHLDSIPTIIIYRNRREAFRITSDWPDAATLARRIRESAEPAGAVSPLKGRHIAQRLRCIEGLQIQDTGLSR